MTRHTLLSGILFCGLFGAHTATAQSNAPLPAEEPRMVTAENYVTPEYISSQPTLPPQLADRSPRQSPRPISRLQAIETALRRNLDLALELEQVRVVELTRLSALAAYEPTLHLWGGRTGSQSPPQTAQEGVAGQLYQSTTDSWNLQISQLLPSAARINLTFNNSRYESQQANAVLPLRYAPSLTVGLTQPLLAGFSLDGRVQWAPVLSARFSSEKERETARLRAMSLVKQTEDAYWDLVEAWKANEVQREAFELASKQLELTRRQIAAGIVAPSELLSAEGRLAQVQVDLVKSRSDIEDAADSLRKLLNLPPEQWQQPLLPVDAPSFLRDAVPFDAAYERALAYRPELKSADLDVRQATLDLTLARNRRLPQLNASTSLSTQGQDPDYTRSLDQMVNRAGWQWNVGLDLSWAPLGVQGRADVKTQQSQLRQRRLSKDKLLLDIRGQIRGALRDLETAEEQVYAAAQSRELSTRNLDLEQRRFLNGLPGVTNFTLAQRQGELAAARLLEIRALLQHERAQSALLLATGELLEKRQLRFELRADDY